MDRYEEALERAKMILCNLPEGSSSTRDIETIFPELKESEGERIRKEIVDFIYWAIDRGSITKEQRERSDTWLAYLEKQKEQKPLCISFACDWLKTNISNYVNCEYNEYHHCVEYDGSVDTEKLIKDFELAMQKEPKDVSASTMAPGCWQGEEKSAEWSKEDKDYYDAIIEKLEVTQDDAMLTDNQMDFLKSLPERLNLQPKQEWSEEDENMLKTIFDSLNTYAKNGHPCLKSVVEDEIAWLKSLRPQPHWKPSEEQMKFLKRTVDGCDITCRGQVALESLYNDLKKLI